MYYQNVLSNTATEKLGRHKRAYDRIQLVAEYTLKIGLNDIRFVAQAMSDREPSRWQHNPIYPQPLHAHKSLRVNDRDCFHPGIFPSDV